jgi:hypothetical protein
MSQLDFAQGSSFGHLRIGYSFYILGVGGRFWIRKSILVFRVLQLQVRWLGRLYFEVLAFKVQYPLTQD